MDDFEKPGDDTRRSDISPEHSPSFKRDKDIARVYELLQSKRPWGAILDAAMSSTDKIDDCPEQSSDAPPPSTLLESPESYAVGCCAARSVGGQVAHPSDESNLSTEAPDWPQAKQSSRDGLPPRPRTLVLISAVMAATIGLGFLSRVEPPQANPVVAGSARALSPTASETDPGLPSDPAPAVSSEPVSLVTATLVGPERGTAQTTDAAEIVHVESHAASPDLLRLQKRADSLLTAGDIASARLFYERAANAGDAQAALKLGETYDPMFLKQINSIGVRGDVTIAARWYRRAAELGASEAKFLLKSADKQ